MCFQPQKCLKVSVYKIFRTLGNSLHPEKFSTDIPSKSKSSQAPSEENPSYHEIVLSFWPNIFIHSLFIHSLI